MVDYIKNNNTSSMLIFKLLTNVVCNGGSESPQKRGS